MGARRSWTRLGAVVVAGFLALQLVPLGVWRIDDPPVVASAPFPSAESEALARAACFDCHSHEVRRPPHAYVAPVSWLVQRDIEEGREELNLSVWDAEQADDAEDAAETVEEGEMPPATYALAHPSARLSDDERAILIGALRSMAGAD